MLFFRPGHLRATVGSSVRSGGGEPHEQGPYRGVVGRPEWWMLVCYGTEGV